MSKKPSRHTDGGFRQKKSLGQNFIEDEALLARLCELSLVTAEDCVLEIGAGFGALTAPLSERAAQVVSVEIDRGLIPFLEVALHGRENVRVVQADVMRTDLAALVRDAFGERASLRVAANLPYYITTDVLVKLMKELPQAKSIAVMVQREVGDKLLSAPGEDGYGPLALMCRYHYEVRRALGVPAACFTPPPKVDSSFMVLERRAAPPYSADESVLPRLVRGAFAMRRKTLANNLSACFSLSRERAVSCMEAAGIDASARAQELSLERFCALSRTIRPAIDRRESAEE